MLSMLCHDTVSEPHDMGPRRGPSVVSLTPMECPSPRSHRYSTCGVDTPLPAGMYDATILPWLSNAWNHDASSAPMTRLFVATTTFGTGLLLMYHHSSNSTTTKMMMIATMMMIMDILYPQKVD